jgi:hypothetical protein
MRTGSLSDESVRKFCKTIRRDESHHQLSFNPLAYRSGRQAFRAALVQSYVGVGAPVTMSVERRAFREALRALQTTVASAESDEESGVVLENNEDLLAAAEGLMGLTYESDSDMPDLEPVLGAQTPEVEESADELLYTTPSTPSTGRRRRRPNPPSGEQGVSRMTEEQVRLVSQRMRRLRAVRMQGMDISELEQAYAAAERALGGRPRGVSGLDRDQVIQSILRMQEELETRS